MTTSAELAGRAAKVLPGGVSSNVRLPNAGVFFEKGVGSRVTDVDGVERIDYLLGQGPAFLGHADARVTEAVARAVGQGMVFGAQTRLELEATEKLVDVLGWPDVARLGVSGTEAVQGAIRIARAATGRQNVVRFAGQYHGWIDTALMSFTEEGWGPGSAGQPESLLQHWRVVPFNDPETLAELFSAQGDDLAAVILEPMMCNLGAIPPEPGFLEQVRKLCDRNGSILIFDEVITGFRLSLGGAARRFGVTPDLAVYGKALAGGWPVSALAGRRDLFDGVATGVVNHSGTFNASVMAAAAVSTTIDILRDDDPYPELERIGARLMGGLAQVASPHVPMRVAGLPMAFHVSFGDPRLAVVNHRDLLSLDLARYERLAHHLASHGLWLAGRGIWYVSTAHDDADVDETIERFDAGLRAFLEEE